MTGGMMSKGTRRPWSLLQSSTKEFKSYYVVDKHGLCISCDDEYKLEDAALISAAPELLEALLMLQKQALQSELNSPNHEWGLEALAAARAAIAKALGEQK